MAEFSEDAARRIAKAIRRIEALPESGVKRPVGPRVERPSKMVRITTAVTAFGSGVYGKGVGMLLILTRNATTGHVTEVDSGISVSVYSRDTAGTDAGLVVQCKVIDELFVIDVDYC